VKSMVLYCVLALAGCAGTPLAALDASHPASPRAAESAVAAEFRALRAEPFEGSAEASPESEGKASRALPAVGEPGAAEGPMTPGRAHRHDH
jgi:hypothetical protein